VVGTTAADSRDRPGFGRAQALAPANSPRPSLLKPRNSMCGGFDVGGDGSFQFPQHEGIKCYAIVSGQCWLSVEGVPEAVHLKTGDCFLRPLGRPVRLASDLALPPLDFKSMHPRPRNGGIAI
jgi:hypothetical protein